MRRGYTILELLTVLTVLGVVALLAASRVRGFVDGAAVRGETARLLAALDAARGAAQRLDTGARLTLADSGYVVEATIDTVRVVAWQGAGAGAAGVALAGGGAPIVFGPAGIAMGASNRTLTLTRGGVTRRVVISRLGRLTY